MSAIEQLKPARALRTIRLEASPQGDCHWIYMHQDARPGVRPCFRTELMEEIWQFIGPGPTLAPPAPAQGLRHLVLASSASAFNLGGDLALFADLIRQRDRARLLAYAKRCVDGVHRLHTGMDGQFRTIALVQGSALGGGLEMALACHSIVAEEGVEMGLPEILFGLFPGMGAYSFLRQRISPRAAEAMILEGRIYSSEEMHAMGVVDVLVPKGEGPAAVQALIDRQQRAPQAHLAMNRIRNMSSAVSHEELMAITVEWVDCALSLGERSLRTMERIVRAQDRRTSQAA